jgi:predicted MFS family arabinose efflux permease
LAESRPLVVAVLGFTQTLAWASSYYIPAILAEYIARDLHIPPSMVFAAFSAALLISAAIGPRVGRTIDAIGGRRVLLLSNVCFAGGLAALAFANSIAGLWLAWIVLGVGMGLGLYDAAFAALGRIFGAKARSPITAITLIAGFASTIGWPLSQWGASTIGWRDTCLLWAAAHILVGLPLNALLPAVTTSGSIGSRASQVRIAWDARMVLIGFALASAWMVTAAMAVHLPRLIVAAGASANAALVAGMLIGPAQVGARLLEAGLLRRMHPLVSARLAAVAHPLAAAALLVLGPAAASAFAILHGAGNGVLTIARGTVPLAVFGPENYGYRLGLLGAPARIAQAFAPFLFGMLIDRIGIWALAVTAGMSLAALTAFIFTPSQSR